MARSVLGEFGVLLVEPDAAERARLKRILDRASGFRVCGAATTGTEAIELAAREEPHVVLLRLGLADLAGYAVTSLISARLPGTAVVVTAREEDDAAARLAMRMGAVGCVLVGSTEAVIVDTVRRAVGMVLTGRRVSPQEAAVRPPD